MWPCFPSKRAHESGTRDCPIEAEAAAQSAPLCVHFVALFGRDVRALPVGSRQETRNAIKQQGSHRLIESNIEIQCAKVKTINSMVGEISANQQKKFANQILLHFIRRSLTIVAASANGSLVLEWPGCSVSEKSNSRHARHRAAARCFSPRATSGVIPKFYSTDIYIHISQCFRRTVNVAIA